MDLKPRAQKLLFKTSAVRIENIELIATWAFHIGSAVIRTHRDLHAGLYEPTENFPKNLINNHLFGIDVQWMKQLNNCEGCIGNKCKQEQLASVVQWTEGVGPKFSICGSKRRVSSNQRTIFQIFGTLGSIGGNFSKSCSWVCGTE